MEAPIQSAAVHSITAEQEIIDTAASLTRAVLDYVTYGPRQSTREPLQDGVLAVHHVDQTCKYSVFSHGDVEIITQHEGHLPEGMTGVCLAVAGEQVESVTLADLLQIRDSLNTLLDCPQLVGALV